MILHFLLGQFLFDVIIILDVWDLLTNKDVLTNLTKLDWDSGDVFWCYFDISFFISEILFRSWTKWHIWIRWLDIMRVGLTTIDSINKFGCYEIFVMPSSNMSILLGGPCDSKCSHLKWITDGVVAWLAEKLLIVCTFLHFIGVEVPWSGDDSTIFIHLSWFMLENFVISNSSGHRL